MQDMTPEQKKKAGNVRLRMTASAGTATPARGSFFRVRRLPAANTGTFVA